MREQIERETRAAPPALSLTCSQRSTGSTGNRLWPLFRGRAAATQGKANECGGLRQGDCFL
jgi:hypothetical protein